MLKQLLACTLATISLLAGPALAAYPEKPIRMIVAWPAGGGADGAARLISERLSKRLGQSVIVENRPGANGMIGTGVAAKAEADGYTLIFATADTHSINPHVYKSIQYDALKDFEPITLVGTLSFVLISSAAFAPNTLDELIAYARSHPQKVSYGTWGIGSTAHVGMASFELATGLDLLHVPYQGSGPATTALLSGQIDLYLAGANGADQHRKSGKVKVFAVAGTKRAPWLPDVKTLSEQGVVGAESGGWYGILAPTGVPKAIRDRLTSEIVAIIKAPDVTERLASAGWDIVASQQDEFAAFMRSEYERYGKIVRSKNISVDK